MIRTKLGRAQDADAATAISTMAVRPASGPAPSGTLSAPSGPVALSARADRWDRVGADAVVVAMFATRSSRCWLKSR